MYMYIHVSPGFRLQNNSFYQKLYFVKFIEEEQKQRYVQIKAFQVRIILK